MNTRRLLLRALALLPAAWALPGLAQTKAALTPTPRDTRGPFYPVKWEGDFDADLLQVDGGAAYSQGTPMIVTGRVQNTRGEALADATVEIWQADATGHYRHPDDAGDTPLKAGFQGFGRVKTNAQGEYRFRTVKPPAYASRPPHIHFQVEAPGHSQLVTQMYFSDDNKERGFSGFFSKERVRLTVTPVVNAGVQEARFDIVLAAR